MGFTLLPALDVVAGRVDRREHDATTPLDLALAWQAAGATWIHLVDLDAALGRGGDRATIAAIVGALDVDVQLSAGVRNDERLAWALSTGCARVVLPTDVLTQPNWCERAVATHGARIAVALDVDTSTHRLRARGVSGDHGDLGATLDRLDRAGCVRYVVTDVERDGTLHGPNVALLRSVAAATSASVVASGGIASLADLTTVAGIGATVDAAIVGRALHAGHVTLADALAAAAAAAPRRA